MATKTAWAPGARTGPSRAYGDLRIFACEGLVCIVDERPGADEGEFTAITPAEAQERIVALNEKYRGKGRMDIPESHRQRYDTRTQGSQNCMECIKEARDMGDPSDPAVRAFWAKHRRTSSVRVTFSPGSDPAGYPVLPPLPLGVVTGRTAPAVGPVAPAFTPLHKSPQPKNRAGIILSST